VNQAVGVGSVAGTITTDGTVGTTLTTADITAWNLTIGSGAGTIQLLNTQASAHMQVFGTGLTATSTGLFFNYSLDASFFLVELSSSTPGNNSYVCWEANVNCTGGPAGIDVCVNCPNGFNTGAAILTQSGTQQIASAGATTIPEPSSLLLVGLGAGAVGYGRKKSWFQRAQLHR
jgi:hypothetical protein